ncbi:hypothetical protein [Demequina sp. NBRC 110054]|uniref:hypothetical protein n=1 Tax=Demequina sp. NBRC 110054 TaxID=1570343 RepID=UPI001177C7DD|nr:hypothetical protein [Demequina sp. NBRC 110054]
MKKTVVTVAAVALVAGGWFGARTLVAQTPEAEAAPDDDKASAIESVNGADLVAWGCTGTSWSEDPQTIPLLAVETARNGSLDACIQIARMPDEDPDGDYYQASVTAYWTTEGGWSAAPWTEVDSAPTGSASVAIEMTAPVQSNVYDSYATALEDCDDADPAYPDGGSWTLTGGCPVDSSLTRDAGDFTASWTTATPSDLDVTVHTVTVKVAEGAEPGFSMVLSSPSGESSAAPPAYQD